MKLAQSESATALATPPLRDATVTLPSGMSLSLPGADALLGCPAAGREGQPGFNLYEEQPGPDGQPHLTPGNCQGAARIGSAKIVTPLLSTPLEGGIYLASPECEPCTEQEVEEGRLTKLYVEANGSGIDLKLPAVLEVGGAGPRTKTGDPTTELAPGQLRLRLQEAPQLPASELQLTLEGGQQPLLSNPNRCGAATTTTSLLGWGAEAQAATPSSSYELLWSAGDSTCPAPAPFAPSFSAGTTSALGGAFSPFTATFARQDREQGLSTLSMRMPPGFGAQLAGVPQCPEAQASLGQCPPASEVGRVHVAIGPGSQPLWVEGGAYLTGPYGNAPFGLSLVIPAKAGPFDLGDVVVRAAISFDPHTAALTIATSPLPTSVNAVPLHFQTVNLTLNRPDFTLNPTNCSQQQIAATLASSEGASSALATPFAVAACKNLPFKPTLTAHTQAFTSREGGASLHIQLYTGSQQANVAKLRVELPAQLSTRLLALQSACRLPVFETNPAACPSASVVGSALVHTPLLPSPLTGPAYFVSHGGAGLPDLELVLKGEGVTVVLDGRTSVHGEITDDAFDTLPDIPMSNLNLMLPEGPHSLLSANASLCKGPLALSTSIAGQNGAQLRTVTHLAVSGCPRPQRRAASR
jgi:hypothetical protein